MSGSSFPTFLLIAFLVLCIAMALVWRRRNKWFGGAARRRGLVPGIHEIRVWQKKPDEDGGIEVTLIESSSGWQLLDEADASGNGVVTVYAGPEKATKTMKCYSLVRRSATVYNRRDYQRLKTECLTKFSLIKDDFDRAAGRVLAVSRLPRPGFEGLLDYLKETQIVRP